MTCPFLAAPLKPNLTMQSFIEAPIVGIFTGDNHGFLDSPADGKKDTYRASISYTYGDDSANVSQGESNIWVPIPLGNGVFLPPNAISRKGTPVGSGDAFIDSGGTYHFRLSVSASNGLFFGIAPPSEQLAYITVNFESGVVSGYVENTVYPATQVFLNGRPIFNYSSEDEATTPGDLASPRLRTFISQYACDPTK